MLAGERWKAVAKPLQGRDTTVTIILAAGVGVVFAIGEIVPRTVPIEVLYAVPLFLAGAWLPRRLAVFVGLVALALCGLNVALNFCHFTFLDGVGFVALVVAGWWAIRTGIDNARLRQVTAEAADLYHRSEEQRKTLAYRALHDELTGLPNRALLEDRLRQCVLAARRAQSSVALLLMDLDRFKDVNDTFGHHYGDLLLQQIGPRISQALRRSDTVARLGGDEFAILLPESGEPASAQLTAARMLRSFQRPFDVDGQHLDVEASIGIALCPQHGDDPETLLRHADIAMYSAKRKLEGYAFYASEQDENTASRLALTGELRQGIEAGDLVLYYQPKVEFQANGQVRAEALIRWQHPSRGLLGPNGFIPLAEQTGLMRPLSDWLLQTALQQAGQWRDEGLEVPIAINLSMRNLHDPGIPEQIANLLKVYGVPPSLLAAEITESTIMADPERALQVVTRLSEMGIGLAVDDFGTGYSSLSYLKRLPVQEIKIDKSFVIDMHHDENDATIVRSTIDLAHNLGLKVVAEGVEHQEVWDSLAALGCDAAQGYYIARPLPAAEFVAWLHTSTYGQQSKLVSVSRA